MISIKDVEEKLICREQGHIGDHKFFSVVILLCCCHDGLKLVFEVRSNSLKSQPGDICFPGGQIEQGESPYQCALRELREETGIDKEKVEIIGQFDTLYGFADYTVYTFVGKIEEETLGQIKINKDEVDEIFAVPIEFFKNNPPMVYEAEVISKVEDFPYKETGISPKYNWRKGKNVLPVYHYENRIIWGMTARITSWFVDNIL